jgi:hypothetical protein
MKEEKERLQEYRILYNEGSYESAQNNYHYFTALSAQQALDFHHQMMDRKKLKCQIISVERKCPWQKIWKSESFE